MLLVCIALFPQDQEFSVKAAACYALVHHGVLLCLSMVLSWPSSVHFICSRRRDNDNLPHLKRSKSSLLYLLFNGLQDFPLRPMVWIGITAEQLLEVYLLQTFHKAPHGGSACRMLHLSIPGRLNSKRVVQCFDDVAQLTGEAICQLPFSSPQQDFDSKETCIC